MNKKLVAVAVAGLLAAPLAQAQTANVTLYGRFSIDARIWSTTTARPASNTVRPVDSVSSRWGLRGSEALGGGMNAIFQCETAAGADDGAVSAPRRCAVGKAGSVSTASGVS